MEIKVKYRNYLENLAKAFKYRFEQISTHYNFDSGDEFEIALCYVLREILPSKYGICRGHVIPADGQSAGDDIIIYDKERFPTLRVFSQESYDRKQDIPIEAVYAYIEAKYTLHINGEINDGQSLIKACSQVAAVKGICEKREPRSPEFVHPYFRSNISHGERPDWPKVLNPVFGAIFALRVKENKKQNEILDSTATMNALVNASLGRQKPRPDLIVAGDSNLIIPCVQTAEGNPIMHSPFYIQDITTSLQVMPSKDIAFATGICTLLYALDTIQLGRMPWESIINNGFGRR
jgi:hypothetical protein